MRHRNTFFITTEPYYNFIDCITKIASKEGLNNLSADDLAMTLDEHFCNQKVDILKLLRFFMGINCDAVNGKSKRRATKTIEKIYEDVLEDADKSEQDKKIYFIDIINEVTTIIPKPDSKELNAPTSSKQKEDTDLDERLKENTKVVNDGDKESDIQAGKAVADDDQEGEGKMNILRELDVLKKTSLLRKEFRVKGSTGEAGQKEKLTYVSLMHQINEAKAAGYDQDKIVNGVIRATVPSLTLRNVLETTTDLNLDRLLSFLEAHFEEKSTNDLWSKLTSMAQSPEESSYSFLLRCIELRQKILIASAKSDIKFDKPLLDKVFCRTLESGLSSTYVVQEIMHLLRTGVSDEELIFEVTAASAAEKERVAIQSKGKKHYG